MSAVGSAMAIVVSKALALAPSKTKALAPWMVPDRVIKSVEASPRVTSPWMLALPLKVLAPAKVWVPVLTRPTLVASAVWRYITVPEITAPLADLV
jgi:hypothetical protein